MKKVVAFLLALTLVLTMAGCGGSGSSRDAADTEEKEKVQEEAAETEERTDNTREEAAGPEEGTDNAAVMTWDAFSSAEDGDSVTVETYVQRKGVYHEEDSTVSLYAQDQEGAYYIAGLPITEEEWELLEEGQKIRVSGNKTVQSGKVTVAGTGYEPVDGEYYAEVEDITDLLGTDGLEAYQNRRVSITGVRSVDIEDVGGDLIRFLYNEEGTGDTGDDLYFCVEKDGETYTLMVDADLCGPESDVYQTIEMPLDEDAVLDLEGVLSWDENGPKFLTTDVIVME